MADRDARRLRSECDEYIEASLADFEETLARTLQIVQRGRGQRSHSGHPGPVNGHDRIGADLLD